MKRLPLEYTQRMKSLLGEDYAAYESVMEEPPVKGFRVNTDKISLEEFEKIKQEQNAPVTNSASVADELKKFKELLDMGAITQEEFDAKKKQLLGL